MGFLRRNKKTALLILAVILGTGISGCGLSDDPEDRFPKIAYYSEEALTEEEDIVRRPEMSGSYQEPEELSVTEQVTEADEKKSGTDEPVRHAASLAEGYVYSTLSDEEKTVYDEILSCVLSHESKVTVSTLDRELLDRCYEAMNADHGELFWVDGYVYTIYKTGGDVTGLDFAPKYTMDYEERLAMQQSIDASVEQILSGISLSASDYEKVKYVFEALVKQVDYDLSAPENQNIISAFVYRRTVCQGYACATQYLLNQLGIESFIVSGTAGGENHAWNMVLADGNYYCVDTTWGNSLVSAADDYSEKFCNYAYLNVTTQDLGKTHHADVGFSLPESGSNEDNYYIKEGLYFSEWLPDEVGELISTAWFSGPRPITVKFSDPDLFARAMSYFVTEGHIADYCPGLTSYNYQRDTDQNVLTILFDGVKSNE